MAAKRLEYRVLTAVGEEQPAGNSVFDEIETSVNEAFRDGWSPVGGVSISAVAGPRIAGSPKDNWFVRVAQAIVREISK
jgi:hypothetical protein